MLLSVSRRTDIPAFYAPWFMQRVREGYCLTPNPFNARRYSRISLLPQDAECLIFWTKNPIPLIEHLRELDARGYRYYFTFTLTGYDRTLEPNLPALEQRIEAFSQLSHRLGPARVDWRYDPVLPGGGRSAAWHEENFARLCAQLAPLTERCIFSFADPYRHLGARVQEASSAFMRDIAARFVRVAQAHALPLFTCCEQANLSDLGVRHGACIDAEKIARILGCPVNAPRDKNQRPACGCVQSVDIGAYGTCPGGCDYCYATQSPALAQRRYAAHDPALPSLLGRLPPNAAVEERHLPSVRRNIAEQTRLIP